MSYSFEKNRKMKKRDYLEYCRNAVKINPKSKRWGDLKTLDPAFCNQIFSKGTAVNNTLWR